MLSLLLHPTFSLSIMEWDHCDRLLIDAEVGNLFGTYETVKTEFRRHFILNDLFVVRGQCVWRWRSKRFDQRAN